MTKIDKQIYRQHKIWLFLSVYALFTLIKLSQSFLGTEVFGNIMTGMLWLTCIIITKATSRRKIFYNKAIYFFFTGVSLWITWGTFGNISRITMVSGLRAYGKIAALIMFTHALFMSARIIEIYDLRSIFMKINVFCIGFVLIFAFIVHFNGFTFLSFISASDLLYGINRYRLDYGLGHYNTAGKMCLQLFIFSSIYQEILAENKTHKKIRLYRYIMFPVAVLIFLASVSRASISSLILFWLTYFILDHFQQIKFFLIILLVFVIYLINNFLWDIFMAGRGFYYVDAFSFMTNHDTWLTGIGLTRHAEIKEIVSLRWLDSFYLTTLLQTGLIGFSIFFGSVFIFIFIYFKDIVHMTKKQKLAGALIAVVIYYGLFETSFFVSGPFDFSNWLIIILCMNEKDSGIRRVEC